MCILWKPSHHSAALCLANEKANRRNLTIEKVRVHCGILYKQKLPICQGQAFLEYIHRKSSMATILGSIGDSHKAATPSIINRTKYTHTNTVSHSCTWKHVANKRTLYTMD